MGAGPEGSLTHAPGERYQPERRGRAGVVARGSWAGRRGPNSLGLHVIVAYLIESFE